MKLIGNRYGGVTEEVERPTGSCLCCGKRGDSAGARANGAGREQQATPRETIWLRADNLTTLPRPEERAIFCYNH